MKPFLLTSTKIPRVLALLGLTFLFVQSSHAEICKLLVDGQVSYKEMPSCEDGEKVNVSSGGFTIQQRAETTDAEKPYSGAFPSKKLLIGEVLYFEQDHPASSVIGRYLFGRECVGSSPISWPEVLDIHPTFFPDERDIRQGIARFFATNSYRADYKNAAENLTLTGVIEDLRIEACATSTRVNVSQMDGKFLEASKYRESAIEMKISWQLSGPDGATLGEFESEGYYDSRNKNRGSTSYSIYAQVQSTIKSATAVLLNNPAFTDLLIGVEEIQAAPVTPQKQEMFSLQSRILIYVIVFIVALAFLKRVLDFISKN